MKPKSTLLGLSLFAATLFSGAPAEAQRLQFSIGSRGEHGSIAVGFNTGQRSYGHGRARSVRGHRGSVRINRHDYGGHYETVQRRFWIEGSYYKEWVAPVYENREYRDDYGRCRTQRVLARQGYWHRVRGPGHFENRPVRAWVSGRRSRSH